MSAVLFSLMTNSLWHAALLSLAVFIALRLFRIDNASLRTSLWSAAFFIAALSPLFAFTPKPGGYEPSGSPSTLSLAVPNPAAPSDAQAPAPSGAIDPESIAIIAALIWLIGLTAHIVWLLAGAKAVARLLHESEPVSGGKITVNGRHVLLRAHPAIPSPIATGLMQATIILPSSMARDLQSPETRSALAHEAAHIRRHDLFFTLMEWLVLCVFWWNPVLRLMRAAIAENREMACDDAAAADTTAPACAAALVTCAERAAGRNGQYMGGALAAVDNPSILSRRVSRLLSSGYAAPSRQMRPILAGLAVFGAVLTFIAISTPRIVSARPFTANDQSQAGQALGRQLVEASARGDLEGVKALLATGADINAVLSRDGTALIAASKEGNFEVASFLIAHGAEIDAHALYDETALITAVRSGHENIIRLLINAGADVNLSTLTESGVTRSPLREAQRLNRTDIQRLLVAAGARNE